MKPDPACAVDECAPTPSGDCGQAMIPRKQEPDRCPLLRVALSLALATILWNLVEAGIAVTAGAAADSVALLGFGLDSLIETASGGVVAWRVLIELRGGEPERIEQTERTLSRIAGSLLILLAAVVLVEAASHLLGHGGETRQSMTGLVLTAVSAALMPLLGRAKLRIARALGSRTLRADAFETITCAWLSITTLAGLAFHAGFGWSWADPLAALVLVPLIFREGLEGWRGECGCHREQ